MRKNAKDVFYTFSIIKNIQPLYKKHINNYKLNSVALDIGGATQFSINNTQSLTLGVKYSYGFRPIEKEH